MSEDWSSLLKEDLLKLTEVMTTRPAKTGRLIAGERREVAVLFLDQKGFTPLSEQIDHEQMHMLIGGVMQTLARVVEAHGGYVDKFEGDLLMALFGAKKAAENDSVRAVACALKMLETIKDINNIISERGLELGVRVGVSYGMVTVGPDPSGHLTATGDEVNVASRMESSAEVNTTQVTERVRRECGEHFEWQDLGESVVKGKRAPIKTYRPTGPGRLQIARWERASRVKHTPLVGREREYSMLIQAWEAERDAASRNPRGGAKHIIIGLKAEAGIGKSRLNYEFMNERRRVEDSFAHLKGQALSYAQPSFWLWTTLLRDHFGIAHSDEDAARKLNDGYNRIAEALQAGSLKEELMDSKPFIAELLSIPNDDPRLLQSDEKSKHQATLTALTILIRAIAAIHPRVAITLDDIHWMDNSSRETLIHLTSNCDTERPLIFHCLYRPEREDGSTPMPLLNPHYAVFNEITIEPLGDEACKDLFLHMLISGETLQKSTPNEIPVELGEFILQRSRGNPFFLEELTLDLIESGALVVENGSWKTVGSLAEIYIPPTLAGLVRSRIDRLPPDQKRGLQHSSVIGVEFLMKLYRRLSEKLAVAENSSEVLSELERRGFLLSVETSPDMRYVFKHILIHNAAYETMLLHNRAILHRYCAEAVQEVFHGELLDKFASVVAHHWELAGDHVSAVRWGIRALRNCRENFLIEDGLACAEKLSNQLALLSESDERDELSFQTWELQAKILELVGKTDVLREIFERMLMLCDRWGWEAKRGRTLRELGRLRSFDGDVEGALSCYQRALEISREVGERGEECLLLGSIGALHKDHSRVEEAKECFIAALEIAREIGDRVCEGNALGDLGMLHATSGNTEEALKCYQRAMEIQKELGKR